MPEEAKEELTCDDYGTLTCDDCGCKEAHHTVCPYAQDICGVEEECDLCDKCEQERARDI